jgi:hypothetical protein
MDKAMKSSTSSQKRPDRAIIERALKAAAKDGTSGRAELQSGRYKPSQSKR